MEDNSSPFSFRARKIEHPVASWSHVGMTCGVLPPPWVTWTCVSSSLERSRAAPLDARKPYSTSVFSSTMNSRSDRFGKPNRGLP